MFSLADFHHRHREEIIQEWVNRLKTEVGRQYSQRPRSELVGTVTEAFDADYHVMINQDYRHINRFIDKITKMRLQAGFLLSDVQKAFELYRIIAVPLLSGETTIDEFRDCLIKINNCLAYTIHRFSDHFQDMHEREILKHNKILEEEVRDRTADLKESELKYKTLVEEITDGYFVVQGEHIIFANQAFCQMHGYEMDEVMQSTFYRFIDPGSRDKVMKIYNKRYDRGQRPKSFEYLRMTKDGRCFPTEILAKNTMYDHKLSSIGICRDITERTVMEKRVREAERMAYIGQITTSLSHEIRNPLSAVKMNLQILNKNKKLIGNDQRRIDISVREVIRLEGILKELLDFAKPIQMEFSRHQVNSILISCLELLEMKFREKRLKVKKHLGAHIPEIRVDPEKLGQTFINLLLNAIEASGRGEEILVMSLCGRRGEPDVQIVIEDKGPGILEKYKEDIFKPFFTTKSKGTGLGLTNVKRIVEAHGGAVEVNTSHGEGSSFRVLLPRG